MVGLFTGTHYWTVGQRAQIAGQDLPYFIAELHPRTQDVIVVSSNTRYRFSYLLGGECGFESCIGLNPTSYENLVLY